MESARVSFVTLTTPSEKVWSWPQLLYFLGSVLACLLLNLAIQYGSGYYNYVSITFVLGAVLLSLLLIPTLFLLPPSVPAAKFSPLFSANMTSLFTSLFIILEVYLGTQDIYLHYNQNPLFPTFARGLSWLNILLVATYLLPISASTSKSKPYDYLIKYRFILIIALVLVQKIAAVFASYVHIIDVGIMMQESSAFLLAGHNPYTSPTAGYGGFNYPPLHLVLTLPFYAFFGDTRFGSIFWELVGVVMIYRLVRKQTSSPVLLSLAELAILLFWLQPRNLFVIEQSWGEPLIVGLLGVSLYFFYYQPAGPWADIWFAAMLAIKQYLAFMGLPLFMLYGFNWKRYALTALIFALIIAPFVLWNPVEFYRRNVLHFFQLPIQTDALSLTSYFWERGILIPRWISPVAAALVSFGVGWLLRRFGLLGYLHTIILTFFTLFLFGQQAFANYYYLISFMQIAALIFFILSQVTSASRVPSSHG